jgi:hypothetical protein
MDRSTVRGARDGVRRTASVGRVRVRERWCGRVGSRRNPRVANGCLANVVVTKLGPIQEQAIREWVVLVGLLGDEERRSDLFSSSLVDRHHAG